MEMITQKWGKVFPTIEEATIRRFASVIDDRNPIHHNESAAQEAGFQGIVAPGVMTLGFLSATIAEMQPGVIICEINKVKFKRPLYAGVAPTVECIVLEALEGGRVRVEFAVSNGQKTVLTGECTLKLPA